MENKKPTYSSHQLISVAEVATALAHGKDIAGLEAVQALAEAAEDGNLCPNLYPPHEQWQNGGNAALIGLPISNSRQAWKSLAVKSNKRHTSTRADFDYPPAASTYHLLADDVFAYATCQKLTRQAAMALRDLAIRYKKELATSEMVPQAEAAETGTEGVQPQQANTQPLMALKPQRGNVLALPSGQMHVQFGELAHKIASALHPLGDSATEGEMLAHGGAWINLEAELLQAVKSGALPVKDPLTFGPHSYPRGNALQTALVSVNDLRAFLVGRPIAIESEPLQTAATPVPVGAVDASGADEPWKEQARARAYEIIKRNKEKDLYPSQVNIADEIAKQFRRDGLTGADGKPLAGAYIKRHALNGISSAQSKLVSTVMRQSK